MRKILNEIRHLIVIALLDAVLTVVPKDKDGMRLVQAMHDWAAAARERDPNHEEIHAR